MAGQQAANRVLLALLALLCLWLFACRLCGALFYGDLIKRA